MKNIPTHAHKTKRNTQPSPRVAAYIPRIKAKGVDACGCTSLRALVCVIRQATGQSINAGMSEVDYIERFLNGSAVAPAPTREPLNQRRPYTPGMQMQINQQRASEAYSVGSRVLGVS
ncbi:hypothetical protein [Kerstersia gyiorum]|uniref:hypothetical protein n=1 Tax=Kerstersia gyiorum TaxID=206506 RepID=UPI00209D4C25|nr:hypothetical protein [Kerstersia gyiorum]MCP1679425.1 hypothetical protein [Kerstersia gyiorum]MCP1823928.1 hypothetical protein [Kerstersia gyiorum]MCP1827369.1 hypothetical protein [Kerstersia gyiorum]MCW2448982.1 hypothetical protein [Kerstersia gyiorum]